MGRIRVEGTNRKISINYNYYTNLIFNIHYLLDTLEVLYNYDAN